MNKNIRRYIIDISEETQKIDIYQTLPEPAPVTLTCDLGDVPADRIEAVGFLAGVMQLLPLAKVMPSKVEPSH